MREASMQHLRRVFKNRLECAGRDQAASELLKQRELAEAVYRQGRITKTDYDDLVRAFDVIDEEFELQPRQLVAVE